MMLQIGKVKLPHKNNPGFTLIELLLVVAIIAIIAAMSLPAFKSTHNRLKLENTVLNLLNITRYARQRSVVESEIYRLNLDTANKQYSLSIVNLEMPDDSKALSGRYANTFQIPTDISFETSADFINFYPNGDCDSAIIVIANSDNLRYELVKEEAFSDFEIIKK
ncbi:MAG: prepilin-type N-terminal cleavage/methylation domain-containing protein [Candidatus Omnitrophota bacterium]